MFKNSFILSIFLHLLIVILIFIIGFFSPKTTIKLNTYNIQIIAKINKPKDKSENLANTKEEEKPKAESIKKETQEVVKKLDNKAIIAKNQTPKEIKNNKKSDVVNENISKKVLQDKNVPIKKTTTINKNIQKSTTSLNQKNTNISKVVEQPKPIIEDKINKDESFGVFLEQIIDKDEEERKNKQTEPLDILANNEFSNLEKNQLKDQLYKCGLAVNFVITEEIVVLLKFKMNEDATTQNIEIIKIISKNTSNTDLDNIKSSVLKALKSPNCIKLPLPQNKYNLWKEFTLTLNLKSFF